MACLPRLSAGGLCGAPVASETEALWKGRPTPSRRSNLAGRRQGSGRRSPGGERRGALVEGAPRLREDDPRPR